MSKEAWVKALEKIYEEYDPETLREAIYKYLGEEEGRTYEELLDDLAAKLSEGG